MPKINFTYLPSIEFRMALENLRLFFDFWFFLYFIHTAIPTMQMTMNSINNPPTVDRTIASMSGEFLLDMLKVILVGMFVLLLTLTVTMLVFVAFLLVRRLVDCLVPAT